MTSVFLAPHADDEALFGAYLCLLHRPSIIICLNDGVHVRQREAEASAEALGCRLTQWHFSAASPDEAGLREAIRLLSMSETRAFAPAVEEDGHHQHNLIGELALEAFGRERVISYLTYAPRGTRSRNGIELHPEPEFIARKLRALSAYRSQMEDSATRPWFYDLLDMREWISES